MFGKKTVVVFVAAIPAAMLVAAGGGGQENLLPNEKVVRPHLHDATEEEQQQQKLRKEEVDETDDLDDLEEMTGVALAEIDTTGGVSAMTCTCSGNADRAACLSSGAAACGWDGSSCVCCSTYTTRDDCTDAGCGWSGSSTTSGTCAGCGAQTTEANCNICRTSGDAADTCTTAGCGWDGVACVPAKKCYYPPVTCGSPPSNCGASCEAKYNGYMGWRCQENYDLQGNCRDATGLNGDCSAGSGSGCSTCTWTHMATRTWSQDGRECTEPRDCNVITKGLGPCVSGTQSDQYPIEVIPAMNGGVACTAPNPDSNSYQACTGQ